MEGLIISLKALGVSGKQLLSKAEGEETSVDEHVSHVESCVNCPVMRAEPHWDQLKPRQPNAGPRADKGVFGEDWAGHGNLPRRQQLCEGREKPSS